MKKLSASESVFIMHPLQDTQRLHLSSRELGYIETLLLFSIFV